MTFDTKPQTGSTSQANDGPTASAVYCSRCSVEETNNASGICDGCTEATRKKEVDTLLEKHGVTRDEVATEAPTAATAPVTEIDDIPIKTNGSTKTAEAPTPAATVHKVEAVYEDPGPDWVDKLGESYKMAREDADEAAPEFVDFPVALVRSVVRENNHITKRDVESVLAEFSMNVSLGQYQEDAMALTVTDINDKAGMKKARELRLVGKRERVRFDQQGVEIKEPLLRRTQLIDGLRRSVRQKFEACEEHLLEQEKFEERENARIAAELQTERIADLAQFEWMADLNEAERFIVATENKIGYLNDTEWTAFRLSVVNAFNEKNEAERIAAEARKAEEERLERENARLQTVKTRIGTLTKLGLNYDGEHFTLGEISVALADIEYATDEAFGRLLVKLEPAVKAAKDAADHADQEKARLQREADEARAELKRKEDERIAEEQRLAEIERQKQLAPEKEKLAAYFKQVHDASTPQPAVDSTDAKVLLDAFFDELATLVNKYSAAASRI